MAGIRIYRTDLFPVGAEVGAWHRFRGIGQEDQLPPGSPMATAIVDADGWLTFTGLSNPGGNTRRGVRCVAAAVGPNGRVHKVQFAATDKLRPKY